MSIFISHVEEDQGTVEEIVRGLQAEGYEAWAYETNTLPGPTYLSQVVEAIEKASAVILVISSQALGSHQVAREIEVAHELDRPIIPVLKDITHEKFQKRRPDWRLALGGYSSIAIPAEGIPAILPRIVGGLKALGIAPGEAQEPAPAAPVSGRRRALSGAKTRPWSIVVGVALLVAVLGGLSAALLLSGGSRHTVTNGTPAGGGASSAGGGASSAGGGASSASPSPLQIDATLAVKPKSLRVGDRITVSYSITNRSHRDIKQANTEIEIVLGQSVYSSNIVIGTITKDVPTGSTVKGSFSSELFAEEAGRQQVLMTIGRRAANGTTIGVQELAEAPVTIER